jgi:hypothetical protein
MTGLAIHQRKIKGLQSSQIVNLTLQKHIESMLVKQATIYLAHAVTGWCSLCEVSMFKGNEL